MEVFNSRRKMGGEEFSLKYREKLEVEIMEAFDNFRILNENKNIFKAANTPITLATVAMICYIASQILGKMKLLLKILCYKTFFSDLPNFKYLKIDTLENMRLKYYQNRRSFYKIKFLA